jgi:hypothetical protein
VIPDLDSIAQIKLISIQAFLIMSEHGRPVLFSYLWGQGLMIRIVELESSLSKPIGNFRNCPALVAGETSLSETSSLTFRKMGQKNE